ncbi:MAG: folate-binding protein [Sphingomonadales bacterium]|jgi:folate-binding protein YgfZ|nr:folate-binding protein [Sphingomonadales bacterium]MBK9004809.1 folate-binding protein [Sphingomonadales bacterium]MBK9267463.1 folate-binding protein [Sphingomonadales bacterium]MBP6433252.1 folate-binding protein [Sphingorhabdus sp.]
MSAPRLFDRAVIRLSPQEAGEDVRAFLQGLVTNDAQAELPLWAGLLTPQGKALFDFFLWADPSTGSGQSDVLIDCEAGQAEALVRRLSLYRLRRKIVIAVDAALGVFWAAAAPDRPVDPRLPELGVRWIAPVADDDADISPFYRAHRLSLGVPEGLAELGSDATLWLETNAAELNGVSFTKGCYVGQENTARMNWRQKVNRRLVVVPASDADPAKVRAAYPELGLAVELRRVENMGTLKLPEWQAAAVAAD